MPSPQTECDGAGVLEGPAETLIVTEGELDGVVPSDRLAVGVPDGVMEIVGDTETVGGR